jgi:hypothetical protein
MVTTDLFSEQFRMTAFGKEFQSLCTLDHRRCSQKPRLGSEGEGHEVAQHQSRAQTEEGGATAVVISRSAGRVRSRQTPPVSLTQTNSPGIEPRRSR